VTDRRVRSDVARSLADIDPDTGRGRLTYATAEELFKDATGGRSPAGADTTVCRARAAGAAPGLPYRLGDQAGPSEP
jgi:hypothetical protein